MAQTPQQRRANAKYAKAEERKMGKPESLAKKKDKQKSPVSVGWIILLAFVVCGGLIFELVKLVPELWKFLNNILASVGLSSKWLEALLIAGASQAGKYGNWEGASSGLKFYRVFFAIWL